MRMCLNVFTSFFTSLAQGCWASSKNGFFCWRLDYRWSIKGWRLTFHWIRNSPRDRAPPTVQRRYITTFAVNWDGDDRCDFYCPGCCPIPENISFRPVSFDLYHQRPDGWARDRDWHAYQPRLTKGGRDDLRCDVSHPLKCRIHFRLGSRTTFRPAIISIRLPSQFAHDIQQSK